MVYVPAVVMPPPHNTPLEPVKVTLRPSVRSVFRRFTVGVDTVSDAGIGVSMLEMVKTSPPFTTTLVMPDVARLPPKLVPALKPVPVPVRVMALLAVKVMVAPVPVMPPLSFGPSVNVSVDPERSSVAADETSETKKTAPTNR